MERISLESELRMKYMTLFGEHVNATMVWILILIQRCVAVRRFRVVGLWNSFFRVLGFYQRFLCNLLD